MGILLGDLKREKPRIAGCYAGFEEEQFSAPGLPFAGNAEVDDIPLPKFDFGSKARAQVLLRQDHTRDSVQNSY